MLSKRPRTKMVPSLMLSLPEFTVVVIEGRQAHSRAESCRSFLPALARVVTSIVLPSLTQTEVNDPSVLHPVQRPGAHQGCCGPPLFQGGCYYREIFVLEPLVSVGLAASWLLLHPPPPPSVCLHAVPLCKLVSALDFHQAFSCAGFTFQTELPTS